jgi:uncharacterized membrane protein (GlpM family)
LPLEDDIHTKLVKSSVYYLDNKDFDGYIPLMTLSILDGRVDEYNMIIKQIKNNLDINITQDLYSIIPYLRYINKVDSIIIHQYGINILRIDIKNNNIGKSAYLNINTYRNKMSEYLDKGDNTDLRSYHIAGLLSIISLFVISV